MIDSIDIEYLKSLAFDAGEAILEIYKEDFTIYSKEDHTPLTQADLNANKIICDGLQKHYPNIPILSEENDTIPYEVRKNWRYYWCIDPLVGTKEFIKKNGEFTVNIALIDTNTPVLGIIYAPKLNTIYYGIKDQGAFKEILQTQNLVAHKEKLPLKVNANPTKNLAVAISKSHLSSQTQDFIDNIALHTKHITLITKGSSLKFCMIAEGEVDLYPRMSPTMEWDTAAGDAIVRASGKKVKQFKTKEPLLYNKEDLENPWFIVE